MTNLIIFTSAMSISVMVSYGLLALERFKRMRNGEKFGDGLGYPIFVSAYGLIQFVLIILRCTETISVHWFFVFLPSIFWLVAIPIVAVISLKAK